MEFREPSTIRINREQKKKAKERLQSLGLTLEGAVANFWNFIIHTKSEEIYSFMSKHTKKLLVILFIGGVLLGYYISKNAVQLATTSLEIIDKVMR